jgi:hypothetical protein
MDEFTTSKPTPMIPHTHLTKADCPDVPDKKRTKLYQQLIGSLMYISCGTRPDISAAVSQCSQFMSNPGEAHVTAAKHILRYLKGTPNVGLTYGGSPACSANILYGYVDADHAGCADDRRSVGGYVLLLNGAAIAWASKKIKIVALSSFEAEWYSASLCGCEVEVVRRTMEEIGFAQGMPTVLYEDNASCIYSSLKDKPMMSRSKHIDTRVWKLREYVQREILKLVKVGTVDQMADFLTKALPGPAVERARTFLSGAGRSS